MASNVNANSGNIYKYCDTCGEALFLGTSHSCESLVNMVKKAIAARDKWWRGLLQEVNEANDLKDLQERFAHLLRYTADLEAKQ